MQHSFFPNPDAEPREQLARSETEAPDAAPFEAGAVPRAAARDGSAHGAADEHEAVRRRPRVGVLTVVANSDVRQQLLQIGVRDAPNRLLGLTAGLAIRSLSAPLGPAHPTPPLLATTYL